MPDLGPHASFILLAYGATVVVLSALVAWIVSDLRAQRTLLAELEARKTSRAAVPPAVPPARAKPGGGKRPGKKASPAKKPARGRKR